MVWSGYARRLGIMCRVSVVDMPSVCRGCWVVGLSWLMSVLIGIEMR